MRPHNGLSRAIQSLVAQGETHETLATLCHVSGVTIHRWRRRTAIPHPAVCQPILDLAEQHRMAPRKDGTP